jgi:PadR family transcriptional regulator, regulatory protein AphA
VSTGSLTLTEAAVLSLLLIEGEQSGYDLLKLAEKSVGHVWAPAKSQLYTTLRRLTSAGLAVGRQVAQSGRPDKQVFRITPEGTEAVERWLDTVEPGADERAWLRMFQGGLMTLETLIAHVEQYRADVAARLQLYRDIEPTNTRRAHDYFHYLMLRHGITRAEATLRWADDVLHELRTSPEAREAERETAPWRSRRGSPAPVRD